MPTTLPTITEQWDQEFLSTWMTVRPEAIDNILQATPIMVALKEAGCMQTQVGGLEITETVRYGTSERKAIAKGDTLNQGEPELDTLARWPWRYVSAHVQRDRLDEQKNNGPEKRKDLIADRLGSARDALEQGYEDDIARTADTTERAHKYMQSIFDIVPDYATVKSGTYGQITRPTTYTDSGNGVFIPATSVTNHWWAPRYMQMVTPREINLVSNMRTLFNTISDNSKPPNLIITDQDTFELYEDFGVDKTQIVKDEGSMLVDLGFDVLRFKGKKMIWSSKLYTPTGGSSYNRVLMLNTDYIKMVYDPNMWFEMTDWKPSQLTTSRIAHILCAITTISNQLRRHGLLTSETIS
jgi:hypothetical protein